MEGMMKTPTGHKVFGCTVGTAKIVGDVTAPVVRWPVRRSS
jgi:hypothetical protein